MATKTVRLYQTDQGDIVTDSRNRILYSDLVLNHSDAYYGYRSENYLCSFPDDKKVPLNPTKAKLKPGTPVFGQPDFSLNQTQLIHPSFRVVIEDVEDIDSDDFYEAIEIRQREIKDACLKKRSKNLIPRELSEILEEMA